MEIRSEFHSKITGDRKSDSNSNTSTTMPEVDGANPTSNSSSKIPKPGPASANEPAPVAVPERNSATLIPNTEDESQLLTTRAHGSEITGGAGANTEDHKLPFIPEDLNDDSRPVPSVRKRLDSRTQQDTASLPTNLQAVSEKGFPNHPPARDSPRTLASQSNTTSSAMKRNTFPSSLDDELQRTNESPHSSPTHSPRRTSHLPMNFSRAGHLERQSREFRSQETSKDFIACDGSHNTARSRDNTTADIVKGSKDSEQKTWIQHSVKSQDETSNQQSEDEEETKASPSLRETVEDSSNCNDTVIDPVA
ncbi:uncharacterized protein KY384_002848 [Bacidia gigantensis]|uniref:uncharacterized protein n=1 Tax=Bacidia gigantensis TaxID=2732470 RepID=UPI001D04848F|nr:uncharacterized protein KY384_002848 [Bacidia gigantensis]KAG8532363.1 hypothetical protein KY384_002848 [Bacidia gigantensis]